MRNYKSIMDPLYTYTKTPKINELIVRIEVAKKVIDLLPQLPHIEANLRRQSLLKSSLFSARIEGNTIELEEIDRSPSKKREKKEVINILRALEWIHSPQSPKVFSKNTLLQLHTFVMSGLSEDAGLFRKEITAIFNQAGVAIYLTPPPTHLPYLLDQLISYSTESSDHPAIIAAKSHFMFEKTHPFVDGNGRVGRLLATLILKNSGLDMHGLLTIEEFLNEHRLDYYDLLSSIVNNITPFIEFFLEAIVVSSEKSLNSIKDVKEEKSEDLLLPRRLEILNVIREQQFCSFDMIKRRFAKIPNSSLHYDLQMLLKQHFIKKLGSTRGVVYGPV